MSARARGRRGRHLAEATAIGGLMLLFAALPPARASDLGGWLGRRLGPRLGRLHRRARANLARALPELDRPARARILAAMWTDLGRVAGEYPHLARIAAGRVGTQDRAEGGAELRSRAGVALVVDPRAAPHLAPGRPAILIAAHLANWELLPFVARRQGVRLAVLMRPPDNPHIARLLARLRRRGATAQLTKSRAGARAALTTLAAGGKLGVLIDQKLREGEPVPFFGRPAPTAPGAARLALRSGAPILPVRVERLGGARFCVTIQAPLAPPSLAPTLAQDRKAATTELLARIHARLESWIRDRPEQWLWVHDRWGDRPREARRT